MNPLKKILTEAGMASASLVVLCGYRLLPRKARQELATSMLASASRLPMFPILEQFDLDDPEVRDKVVRMMVRYTFFASLRDAFETVQEALSRRAEDHLPPMPKDRAAAIVQGAVDASLRMLEEEGDPFTLHRVWALKDTAGKAEFLRAMRVHYDTPEMGMCLLRLMDDVRSASIAHNYWRFMGDKIAQA